MIAVLLFLTTLISWFINNRQAVSTIGNGLHVITVPSANRSAKSSNFRANKQLI
jgi:hypothetical protein